MSHSFSRILASAALLFGVSSFSAHAQSPVINEVMQSNIDCLFVDHEFPDSWLELYNPTSSDINIGGWAVGTSDKIKKAWKIPSSTVIKAGGYLLIYCDKTGDNGLHASFRIDSGKGSIYLFDAQGNVVEQLDLKKQIEPNVAYGRTSDGGDKWSYFVSPSPEASNNSAVAADDLLPEPEFSVPGMVTVAGSGAVKLTVSIPADAPADAFLCVTTDGREPVEKDKVSGNSVDLNFSSTRVVRAKLISPTALQRRSTTHSYIFHPVSTDLDVVSIVTDNSYFYDSKEGIFIGEDGKNPNWEKDWRRPINIEYFQGSDHELAFNQLSETRVQGGWSRKNAQKSLAVYSNKRFGIKRFYANIWEDKPNVTEPQSFILRNGGNCFEDARINDQLGHKIIGTNSPFLDWQAYTPAVYYINGKYMGITDVRERSNEDYVAANYDGLEDIDMLENHWEVKAGDEKAYNELLDYVNSGSATLDGLRERIDVDNFLDMMVIKAFGHDTDFPDNNIVAWRPTADGGKWRWLLKDIDRLGIHWMQDEINNDYLDHIESKINDRNQRRNCMIFKLFYTLDDAKDLYIDRMAVYMGDMLSTENAQSMIDEMAADIEPEYLRHLKVYFPNDADGRYEWWGDWSWKGHIRYLRDSFWPQRREAVYKQLKSRFKLGNVVPMTIDRGETEVTFNGLNLSQSKWNGKFFAGRTITLESADETRGWIVKTTRSGRVSEQKIPTAKASFTLASDASKVEVSLVDASSAIDEITAADSMALSVTADGGSVSVVAGEKISRAEVFDASGVCLADVRPDSESVRIDIDRASAVLIVRVTTASATTVRKLTR